MCVGICGQASGESVDPCNFYSFKKNQKRKFHIFFSELQIALIFLASETRDCSAKIEQMKRKM